MIDDEQSILDLVSGYLRQEGCEVHTAVDGPSGLKATRAFRPDLLPLDIMLPGMDGRELVGRLRREPEVYAILLTAPSACTTSGSCRISPPRTRERSAADLS